LYLVFKVEHSDLYSILYNPKAHPWPRHIEDVAPSSNQSWNNVFIYTPLNSYISESSVIWLDKVYILISIFNAMPNYIREGRKWCCAQPSSSRFHCWRHSSLSF